MPKMTRPNLDDTLGMAETCARLHVTRSTVGDYPWLVATIRDEAEGWDYGGPAANAAVLETYLRVYREHFEGETDR